jgi:hypothetical protein
VKQLNKINIQGLNKKGIYKIYFYVNDNPYPINRIIKSDESGLVYIGCTKKQNFEIRLNNFLLSRDRVKTNNHPGGDKISRNISLNKFFSNGVLMFEINECENPFEVEYKLINDYFLEFGEKPPLNG